MLGHLNSNSRQVQSDLLDLCKIDHIYRYMFYFFLFLKKMRYLYLMMAHDNINRGCVKILFLSAYLFTLTNSRSNWQWRLSHRVPLASLGYRILKTKKLNSIFFYWTHWNWKKKHFYISHSIHNHVSCHAWWMSEKQQSFRLYVSDWYHSSLVDMCSGIRWFRHDDLQRSCHVRRRITCHVSRHSPIRGNEFQLSTKNISCRVKPMMSW